MYFSLMFIEVLINCIIHFSAQYYVVQPINDIFTTNASIKRPIVVPLNNEVSRNKRVDRTVVTVITCIL